MPLSISKMLFLWCIDGIIFDLKVLVIGVTNVQYIAMNETSVMMMEAMLTLIMKV